MQQFGFTKAGAGRNRTDVARIQTPGTRYQAGPTLRDRTQLVVESTRQQVHGRIRGEGEARQSNRSAEIGCVGCCVQAGGTQDAVESTKAAR